VVNKYSISSGYLRLAAAVAALTIVVDVANAASLKFLEHHSSPIPTGDDPRSIAAADFDGDGDVDLAVATAGADHVTMLRNKGSGKFAETASSPISVGDTPFSIVAADFDSDGDIDLAVANVNSNNVSVLKNNGSGKFIQPHSSPVAAGSAPVSITAADFDIDGDIDRAVVNIGSNSVTILANKGMGNFTEPASSPVTVGSEPVSIAVGDLDGDGGIDLATANRDSNNVTILKNR
jgi:hypothetical protein